MDTNDFYKKCLQEELAKRCEKNPHYSMRAMAKALGLEAGTLSLILSGKKIPSYNIAQKILNSLTLEPEDQKLFLQSLAETHQSRGLERMSPSFRRISTNGNKLNSKAPKELSLDLFRVIGDWYHYAVLMLTYVDGFKPSAKWIASQLSITEVEAKLAIERLINVGLIEEKDGTFIGVDGHITTADKHITTPALKKHTKQSLEKAIFSLENDPIDVRSMTYMTMAIDPDKIDEAKKLVEEFTNKMSTLLESSRRTQVYEFGVYLYPLQKKNEK